MNILINLLILIALLVVFPPLALVYAIIWAIVASLNPENAIFATKPEDEHDEE